MNNKSWLMLVITSTQTIRFRHVGDFELVKHVVKSCSQCLTCQQIVRGQWRGRRDWELRLVSIQMQSLALRALRKRKPQETQALALASSQSWLPLLRASIPIGWRLRLLREMRFLRFSFTQRNASDCV